jgi:hypothetical protein
MPEQTGLHKRSENGQGAGVATVSTLMFKHNIISSVRKPRPKAWNLQKYNLYDCETLLLKLMELELTVCKF